ncbi:hypothetical protein DENSPDRAFT_835536 [Dentipellis sp. KUC8613]|nr:hypothetical protein DENSPDRAFT_835536 [Dentipellis sp. KUC8613]
MEYFRPYHRVSPPVSNSLPSLQDEVSHAIDEQSIYIFPSPPSAPPSPSGHSTLSYCVVPGRSRARDESVSSLAQSSVSGATGWEEVKAFSERPPGTRTKPLNDRRIEVWQSAFDSEAEDSESVLEEEITRASRWDMIPPRIVNEVHAPPAQSHPHVVRRARRSVLKAEEHISYIRTRTQSSSSASTSPAVPHPRIRLPLLSFFASFFSIDDATLHLISQSPSHSILFPGSGLPPDILSDSCEGLGDTSHGMCKLLTLEGETTSVREGMLIACDASIVHSNPFIAAPLPLAGLIGLVKGVWAGGANAARDFWR